MTFVLWLGILWFSFNYIDYNNYIYLWLWKTIRLTIAVKCISIFGNFTGHGDVWMLFGVNHPSGHGDVWMLFGVNHPISRCRASPFTTWVFELYCLDSYHGLWYHTAGLSSPANWNFEIKICTLKGSFFIWCKTIQLKHNCSAAVWAIQLFRLVEGQFA
jgi:hypothetical protein